MPRKANVSLDDQRLSLARRSTAIEVLDAKRKLNGILKLNPHLWATLLTHAKTLGYTCESDVGVPPLFV